MDLMHDQAPIKVLMGVVTRGVTICLAGGAYDRLSVSLWEWG